MLKITTLGALQNKGTVLRRVVALTSGRILEVAREAESDHARAYAYDLRSCW